MRLTLTRDLLGEDSTEGQLAIDGEFFCYTLELPVKDGLPGSAIPPGEYRIQLEPSPKFISQVNDEALSEDYRSFVKQYAETIPHLLDLPSTRSNILIHWGNDPKDTEGCILVGNTRGEDFVGSSRDAFEALHAKLLDAQSRGEPISIEVQGGIPTAIESEA